MCNCGKPNYSGNWCYGMWAGIGCYNESWNTIWINDEDIVNFTKKYPNLQIDADYFNAIDDRYNSRYRIKSYYIITSDNVITKDFNFKVIFITSEIIKELHNRLRDITIESEAILIRDEYYKSL